MGKKAKASAGKAAAKAQKKAKAVQKTAAKTGKKKQKEKVEEEDEEDLMQTLEEFRRKWEEDHKVSEEIVEGPPSRRANATLTPCPVSTNLWLFGGEFFDGDRCFFYNDLYRYNPEKNEWRLFTCPTSPGPRSAHQVVAVPSGGGKLWLWGGEFASQKQTSFFHYRDFWCFDVQTHSWERLETKVKPIARSGHRMAVWKHFIVLFGGFVDTGVKTKYLSDLWVFDTTEYKWQEVLLKETDRRPRRVSGQGFMRARSGFSFLPCAEGVVLHGGYSKEYIGKKEKGVPLDDTWLLKMNAEDTKSFKWEKRKRLGYVPSLRSGATMATWTNKSTGVLFGGVLDEEQDDDSLQSVFYNDLFGYQLSGNGRWISLPLRKPKKKGGKKKSKPPVAQVQDRMDDEDEEDRAYESGDEAQSKDDKSVSKVPEPTPEPEQDDDPDDPEKTVPLPRYNAMLAVQRNTLYIYGGIFESQNKEYTLDDFYTLQLDKLDRYTCLKECKIDDMEWNESESEDEDEEDGEDDESDSSSSEEEEQEQEQDEAMKEAPSLPEESNEDGVAQEEALRVRDEKAAAELREKAQVFLGTAKQTERSEEDVLSTPLPGETLRVYYERSRQYWAQKAHETSDNRGKALRRDGFQMASERYESYKPILDEITRIQEEAGLENDEMTRKDGGPGASGAGAASRHRR